MREGWREVRLSEAITLHYGKPMRDVDRVAGEVPVVGSAGIFGWHNEPNVRTRSSIIVGRKGTAGSVTWFDGRVWATDTSYWVEPKIESSMEFIYLLLQNADLPGMTAQTGVPGLNRDRAYSAQVNLPPLQEQQRIVDLIGSLDDAIKGADTATEAARLTVTELRRHLLAPKDGWRKASVEDMCHKITSGGTPNRNVPGYYTSDPSGIPWVKTSELVGGVISDTSEHITKDAVSGSSAKLLPAGTVLMAMYCIGTLGSVGILGREMTCNQASCAMIPDTEIVLPEILSYLLANDRAHLENISTGAAQRNINAGTVRALTYSLPGLAEQLKIVDLVVTAEGVVKGAAATAVAHRTARSEILTALLSGKHEIPESYDLDIAVQLEPAA